MRPELYDLVEQADMNALLGAVDRLCADSDWDTLFELADACEDAVERGKQLWPIAAHVDYRVALEAPGEYAAQVLEPETARFSHGPLTEVAASTHKWAELADQIEIPQVAAYVAQERVLRGEVLVGDERAHGEILDLPLELEPWEPTYALAVFGRDHVEVAEPWDPKEDMRARAPNPGPEIDDPDLTGALIDLVSPWISESNGAARAVVVEGDAAAAASVLAGPDLRIGKLEPDEALQRMAWAAASGGAHGRRRGAALGRSMAWYVAALVTDTRWPANPEELGRAIEDVGWYRWDEAMPEKGWVLRIAVEDPSRNWAAAIDAADVDEEDEEEDAE